MISKSLKKSNCDAFFDELNSGGYTIIAPIKKGSKTMFSRVSSFSGIELDTVSTTLSPKEIIFPRVERLLSYKNNNGNGKTVNNIEIPDKEVVVFGIRPCDAAGIDYLAKFFHNENSDYHINRRRELTTIITIGCTKEDPYCFCTSVGLSPAERKGSDIYMLDKGDGSYYVEALTEKGERLINNLPNIFENSPALDVSGLVANVKHKFEIENIHERLEEAFDSPFWKEKSLSCLGCGTCAFSCPTCSCFDIQDEGNAFGGVRLRLWDTCAQGLFTLHASGHNPREMQSQRWRNRIMHKFDYSVKNLDMISCVGCGRCGRNCPAGMSIVENILMLEEA